MLLLPQATLSLVRSAVSQGGGVRRQTGWQRALSWIGVAGLLLVSWSAMVSKVGEEPCRREHRMKVVFDLSGINRIVRCRLHLKQTLNIVDDPA
jgi:hypothetical protein